MLRLSNGSIYLALAVLAILIRCAAAAVVATAARCALASGAALMAPPLRARRSCRRRRRRRCYRRRLRWPLLLLVTRDPSDLAPLALRVVAAAAAALYVPVPVSCVCLCVRGWVGGSLKTKLTASRRCARAETCIACKIVQIDLTRK